MNMISVHQTKQPSWNRHIISWVNLQWRMESKPSVMSRIANEQLTEEPRELRSAISMNINKKVIMTQNLMLGVYLSLKTNCLTGSNISLFTVFDLCTPLTMIHWQVYQVFRDWTPCLINHGLVASVVLFSVIIPIFMPPLMPTQCCGLHSAYLFINDSS